MTMSNHNAPVAHVNLICVQSSLLLERLLQTLRYRGFNVVSMASNDLSANETEVHLVVKGQGKLTTLQKSFEALIEVQQCYLTADQAKLASLLEFGLASMFSPAKTTQPGSYAAEGA